MSSILANSAWKSVSFGSESAPVMNKYAVVRIEKLAFLVPGSGKT